MGPWTSWASASVGDGITMTPSPAAQDALPGGVATFSVTLANANPLLDQSVALSASVPANASANWTPATIVVPHAGNATATLNVTVPADAAVGTLFTIPLAASDATTGALLASANVTVRVVAPASSNAAPAPQPPTLQLTAGPSAGSAGANVTGTLRLLDVASFGSVDATLAIGGPASWAPRFALTNFARLYQGAPQTVALAAAIPANAANGTYSFPITVTATDANGTFSFVVAWNITATAAPATSAPAPDPTSGQSASTSPSPTTGPAPTPAAGAPNLALRLVAPQDLTPGYASQEGIEVENTGNVPLHVTLVASAADGSWNATVSPDAFDLPAGDVRPVTLTIETPATAGSARDGSAKASLSATTDQGVARVLPLDLRIPAAPPQQHVATAPAPTPPALDAPPVVNKTGLAIAVGLGAVGAGALVLARRPMREKLLWIGVGLYTRLARPDVLGHEEREKLHQIIQQQPGVHFHALQRELGWNTGTLTYHLRVLEKHGFVVDRRDGLYRRFYVTGAAPRKEVFETTGPQGLRADVLEAVRGRQGLSQTDLALALGANKQTVNYHVKALEPQGLIRLEKRGRETFLYPSDAATTPPGREAHA